jgi:hypothetical protein
MNSWSVYEFGRQLEYKARWEGIQVYYVPARGTTAKCSTCGSKMVEIPNGHRMLYCPKCELKVDRDENAARNILAKGLLRFGIYYELLNSSVPASCVALLGLTCPCLFVDFDAALFTLFSRGLYASIRGSSLPHFAHSFVRGTCPIQLAGLPQPNLQG